MTRFFSATAMGWKLYPAGLGDAGPWRPERLIYCSEEVARMLTSPYPHDSLVMIPEDLGWIVSASGLPAARVWIREDLEDVAQQIWEEQQRRQGIR